MLGLNETLFNSSFSEDRDDKIEERDNEINKNIYRYKFKEDFTSDLYVFSKVHQYDDRHSFKEAWNIWVEDNKELIEEEVKRLIKIGYDGDVLDKMFKSARYYFRKKSTGQKEPIKRRNYVGVQKELLQSMDKHINSNINNPDYKPSEGFSDFCKENTDVLKIEVNHLCKNGMKNSDEIKNKIKKTYKNRYFNLTLKKI